MVFLCSEATLVGRHTVHLAVAKTFREGPCLVKFLYMPPKRVEPGGTVTVRRLYNSMRAEREREEWVGAGNWTGFSYAGQEGSVVY